MKPVRNFLPLSTVTRRTIVRLALIAFIFLPPCVPQANARGWSWDLPPGHLTISGKRNNVFYVGETPAFWISKPASRYEVRDYFGNLVDADSINGTSVIVRASEPGWYKLYVYTDSDQGEPWGKIVGGTTFVIFRNNSSFPDMPSSFEDGKYLVWDVKGHVKIRVTNVNTQEGWSNAVINGLFFGMPNVTPSNLPNTNAVRYVTKDSQSHGNWKGIYGSDGYNVIGDAASYPSYATVQPAGNSFYTWEPTTQDPRALQKAGGTDRVAACWYTAQGNPPSFTVDVNINDGQTHRFALYVQNWASGSRAETIEMLDATTGAVLDSQKLGSIVTDVNDPEDEVMRGVTGMGPQRHYVADASNPDADIARLKRIIAVDKEMYLPFDPVRKRSLLIAFSNGTDNLAGVRKVVEAFKDDVKYYEPRNEPNFSASGANFVTQELIPFYQTVKSVSPTLKVIGPGIVTIGPGYGLPWIEGFLRAGGANYLDGFSFHAYNNVNGDFALTFASLQGLNSLLARYNASHLEKWQTEQGYSAAVYGSYQPRLQGRWTMVQMMAYEQFGIPKEHNHLWYDRSHGFWDVPTWWENDDRSLNPAVPLMRVWSEELYGTMFSSAFDFGVTGNQLYVGSLFTGPGKTVAAFMSAGSTDGRVGLAVTGGNSIHCVSAFGIESDLPVVNGRVTLPVPELPVYVELQPGQSINVIPVNWGTNLAVQSGVTAVASGNGVHPINPNLYNSIDKIHNGTLENWYYGQGNNDHPWMDNTTTLPAWVELRLPTVQTIDRVVVYAVPPWQWEGTLLDYELQYDSGGQWITLEHVVEPAKTFKVYTPNVRCTVDSFFSDRWVFQHSFLPIQTQKVRLLVHNLTWGGGATQDVSNAGGQTGAPNICLREIEVYNSASAGTPGGNGNPPPGPNTPPAVSIASPSNGTVFTLPQNVAVQATASDSDGTVTKVEFFAGSTKLGEATNQPYTFQWSNVAPGTYSITAKAYDDGGLSTTSASVNFTVNAAGVQASAVYLQSDLATRGNWKGVYGAEGFYLIGSAVSNPSYATVSTSGNSTHVWLPSTADVRALQKGVPASDRIAACWYTPTLDKESSFTVDVNITDGNAHKLAVYVMDWDSYGPRSESIEVMDSATGAVLDKQSCTSFQAGRYLVWKIQGHVKLKVTNSMAGSNATISGLFFDAEGAVPPPQPPPDPGSGVLAQFVRVDSDTKGNWTQSYGGDGFEVIGSSAAYPSYATVTPAGTSTHTWASSTNDNRALQRTNHVAGCWYSTTNFTVDVNLTDGQTHRVAFYALDWDLYGPRVETIEVLDASSGNVIDSRPLYGFRDGAYLVWDIKGHVKIRVTNNQPGSNAVLSGILFGASGASIPNLAGTTAASFVRVDRSTQGGWTGVYGADGGIVIGNAAKYPQYAVVTPIGNSPWVWEATTSDGRALETMSVSDRIAACWYTGPSNTFTLDVNMTDGQSHRLALYALDWDIYGPRSETIEVVDASNGEVLDTQSLASFSGGKYLVWDLKGHLQIRVTNTKAGSNAVIGGLFFGSNGRDSGTGTSVGTSN